MFDFVSSFPTFLVTYRKHEKQTPLLNHPVEFKTNAVFHLSGKIHQKNSSKTSAKESRRKRCLKEFSCFIVEEDLLYEFIGKSTHFYG